MTASDLATIESEFSVALPEAYRATMLAYPLNPSDINSQIALLNEAKAVIGFNRFLREQFPDEWQSDHFAIGNSPCGDPYFLDLADTTMAVMSWDHESHEIAEEAGDLDTWLEDQRAMERQ